MSNIKTRPVDSGLKSEACLCILDIASSFFPSGATGLRPEGFTAESRLSNNRLKSADLQLTMERDRNRDGAVFGLLLHHRVTAFLSDPAKTVRFQYATNVVSRENAQLRHGLLRSE
jgi:hypothetical protein